MLMAKSKAPCAAPALTDLPLAALWPLLDPDMKRALRLVCKTSCGSVDVMVTRLEATQQQSAEALLRKAGARWPGITHLAAWSSSSDDDEDRQKGLRRGARRAGGGGRLLSRADVQGMFPKAETIKLSVFKLKHTLKGASDVHAMALAPDGSSLALASGKSIRVCTLPGAELKLLLTGHAKAVTSVACSPDSKLLASGSDDCTVRLWDLGSGSCLKVLAGHEAAVASVAISDDGSTLASASQDETVGVWSVRGPRTTSHCLMGGHTGPVWSVAFLPGRNDRVVSGGSGGSIRLWDTRPRHRGYINVFRGHGMPVTALAPFVDGSGRVSIASSSLGGCDVSTVLRVWSAIDDSERCKDVAVLHRGQHVLALAVNREGTLAVTGGADGLVHVWDLVKGTCIKALQGHMQQVMGVALSPDGRTAISASLDKTVKLWQLYD